MMPWHQMLLQIQKKIRYHLFYHPILYAELTKLGSERISYAHTYEYFSRKKYQSLIIYIKPNVIYLTFRCFYRMRLLEKRRKKYHGSIIIFRKCIIKILIRSRKMLLISGNKLQKHIKKCCFQAINTLFSRYNRNFSLKT